MIYTFSKFYYGHTITAENNKLNFKEGAGPELTATFNIGSYTLTEFLVEIKRALEDAGALTYTVTVSRATRIITIASTSAFSLLVTTGTNFAVSVFGLIGFTGADRTAVSTYSGNVGSGFEYVPPFKLQNYIDPKRNSQAIESTVLEAADGTVQTVSFGNKSFAKMKIVYVTDIPMKIDGMMKSTGPGTVDKLVDFMDYSITKAPMEFIEDEDVPSTFYKVILESTGEEKKGTAYELKELFDKNLPDFYETSLLTMRVL
jgi:hypothetical protein